MPALDRPQFTYLAPAAAGRTWYPLSFMAEIEKNEPGLTSALTMLAALVASVESHGVPRSRIVMLGFSQGACLDFGVRRAACRAIRRVRAVHRRPHRSGRHRLEHAGSFDGTPIFLGSSDPDPHVPPSRVEESAAIYTSMGARVTTRIYPGMGHTVNEDEIAHARAILDDVWAAATPSVS